MPTRLKSGRIPKKDIHRALLEKGFAVSYSSVCTYIRNRRSEADFVKMYNQSNTFFCKGLPDMYAMAAGVTVK